MIVSHAVDANSRVAYESYGPEPENAHATPEVGGFESSPPLSASLDGQRMVTW